MELHLYMSYISVLVHFNKSLNFCLYLKNEKLYSKCIYGGLVEGQRQSMKKATTETVINENKCIVMLQKQLKREICAQDDAQLTYALQCNCIVLVTNQIFRYYSSECFVSKLI